VAWASSPRMDHQPSEWRHRSGQDAHCTIGCSGRVSVSVRIHRSENRTTLRKGDLSTRKLARDDMGGGTWDTHARSTPVTGHGHGVGYGLRSRGRSRTKPFQSSPRFARPARGAAPPMSPRASLRVERSPARSVARVSLRTILPLTQCRLSERRQPYSSTSSASAAAQPPPNTRYRVTAATRRSRRAVDSVSCASRNCRWASSTSR
jgi:hypothetical protein